MFEDLATAIGELEMPAEAGALAAAFALRGRLNAALAAAVATFRAEKGYAPDGPPRRRLGWGPGRNQQPLLLFTTKR